MSLKILINKRLAATRVKLGRKGVNARALDLRRSHSESEVVPVTDEVVKGAVDLVEGDHSTS